MKSLLHCIFHQLSLTIILVVFLSLLCALAVAQQKFDFNINCQKAYKEIIQLKLARGQEAIDAEKKNNPDNLIPYFLENYIDFFTLFFNEDPAEYKQRKQNLDIRIHLMDQGPNTSPFFLFTKSVIHFQWSAVKIKFGNNWDAGWELRRSFLQGKENKTKFPSFNPNAMLNGAMEVVAGTIPDGYKWLSSLLGIQGNIKSGMQQIGQFLSQTDSWALLFHDEAIFYYLYLKFYIENKKEEVFAFLANNKVDLKNNHLFTYLAVNLGINNQQSAYAKDILTRKNGDPDYFDMPLWDLEMGYIKLSHLDPDADVYLERFTRRFKGKFYLKDVLQKLSWFYYLQGNQQKANDCRRLVLERGNADTEADKQALREAKLGKWPNKILLKARLLNDGGYHNDALQLLNGKGADFLLPEEKLEFSYRVGRIYDDLGRDEEAITAYQSAINLGEHRTEYFAARAALQTGYIYEKKQEKSKAVACFQKCISLKVHDYKNSLDQKAKAGIERCKSAD